MDDLDRYVLWRESWDPGFADALKRESAAFRVGVMLQLAREDLGLTQEQVAERMGTKKSAISRIENNAGDLRLSTLQRYAEAVGRRLVIEIREAEDSAKPAKARKPRSSRKRATADTPA